MATALKDVSSGAWTAVPIPAKVLDDVQKAVGKSGRVELEAGGPIVIGRRTPFLFQLERDLRTLCKKGS